MLRSSGELDIATAGVRSPQLEKRRQQEMIFRKSFLEQIHASVWTRSALKEKN
jgi:hypothetical protein